MSWSTTRTGTKAAVAAAIAADLDAAAKNYQGQEEGKDVLAAKERALAMIEGLDLTPDTWAKLYGVQVSASGSASKFSANFKVEVSRIPLSLDA